MPTWEDVRRVALELPEAEESTSWRQPCFRVDGRPFVNMSPHPGERDALVIRVELEEKQLMLGSRPGVYWESPHYGYGAVLVRLEEIAEDELRERVLESWLMVAPKRLVLQLETSASDSA
jgi:hypothetical protein